MLWHEDEDWFHRLARALAAIVIAIGIAAILIYAAEGQQREVELYKGVPFDAHLLALDKVALEKAYEQHLARLWNVWLSDGAKEASRISAGLLIARTAYRQAAEQISKREKREQQQ
jgi:hypothetical protein